MNDSDINLIIIIIFFLITNARTLKPDVDLQFNLHDLTARVYSCTRWKVIEAFAYLEASKRNFNCHEEEILERYRGVKLLYYCTVLSLSLSFRRLIIYEVHRCSILRHRSYESLMPTLDSLNLLLR